MNPQSSAKPGLTLGFPVGWDLPPAMFTPVTEPAAETKQKQKHLFRALAEVVTAFLGSSGIVSPSKLNG